MGEIGACEVNPAVPHRRCRRDWATRIVEDIFWSRVEPRYAFRISKISQDGAGQSRGRRRRDAIRILIKDKVEMRSVRLLQKQGLKPKRLITDKLGSYGAAKKQVMPGVERRSHKGLNNRAENSHVPFRKRERILQHFRSAGALQRFVSVFSDVRNLFVPPRASRSALGIHLHRLHALARWNSVAIAA